MRRATKLLYVLVVLLIGWGLPAIEFRFGTEMEFISEFSLKLICFFTLAALTFPAGIVGVLFGVALVMNGIAEPDWEALIVTTPVVALLGYLQWFWIFPRLYRRKVDVSGIF